jgi:hypothetical protein
MTERMYKQSSLKQITEADNVEDATNETNGSNGRRLGNRVIQMMKPWNEKMPSGRG